MVDLGLSDVAAQQFLMRPAGAYLISNRHTVAALKAAAAEVTQGSAGGATATAAAAASGGAALSSTPSKPTPPSTSHLGYRGARTGGAEVQPHGLEGWARGGSPMGSPLADPARASTAPTPPQTTWGGPAVPAVFSEEERHRYVPRRMTLTLLCTPHRIPTPRWHQEMAARAILRYHPAHREQLVELTSELISEQMASGDEGARHPARRPRWERG